MNATLRTNADRRGCTAETLGDLLYADGAKTYISEQDWFRLVQSVAAGDRCALRALYDRAHRVVFTLIVRITHERQAAEELTLEVFYDVWRRAPTYDAEVRPVLGWILNLARAKAIDRLQLEQREKLAKPHADDPISATAASGSGEVLDQKGQGRLLLSALTVLAPDERQAIETAFFSELTYTEVAARLNQPPGTVKTKIGFGLEKLRQALAKGVRTP